MKIRNKKLYLCLFFLLISPFSIAELNYQVSLVPQQETIKLQLILPFDTLTPTKLVLRGTQWGLNSQVKNVRCANQLLTEDKDGAWFVPFNCTLITWEVKADDVTDEGANANEQRSLKIDDGRSHWYLLAEPTSILRLQNEDQHIATIKIAQNSDLLSGATRINDHEYLIPSINNAPEFYVIGTPSSFVHEWKTLTLTHIPDSPEQFRSLDLENLHSRSLDYLLTVVPPPEALSAEQRNLQIIWLGVSESKGYAGGAAGSRSFVANYIIGSPEHQNLNVTKTLLIAAHEQFHQLADMLRGNRPAQPIWFNESLAQYYGFKSLIQHPSSLDIQNVKNRFIHPNRPVHYGLLELERQYGNGDSSVYELFYSQGATFWYELDSAINQASNETRSLDEYIADLLQADFTLDEGLPASFIDSMHQLVGIEKFDALVKRYLGE